MASTRHRSPIATRMPFLTPTLLPLLLLLLTLSCAEAQGSPGPANDSSKPYGYGKLNRFTPSSAILIVVLVCAFFFLAFFSVYIRQCTSADGGAARSAPAPAARSRRQRGLDPEVLATFPTLAYAEAKKLKIGKGTLECAVCLSEFDDNETLRLLPPCSHVFHPDCIAAWLDAHVTCPVCRADLTRTESPDPEATAEPQENESVDAAARQTDSFVIAVNEGSCIGVELSELARIRSERRAARFRRSRSTGDAVAQPGTGVERYTLRLPEDIRREIVSAGRLQRAKSCAVAGEGSSRPWWKWAGGGGGGGGGRRSVHLGRSDRRPSFLARTISARVPAWASGRRGDGRGSSGEKGGGEEEGSTRGKSSAAVQAPLDCLGGAPPPAADGAANESVPTQLVRV